MFSELIFEIIFGKQYFVLTEIMAINSQQVNAYNFFIKLPFNRQVWNR